MEDKSIQEKIEDIERSGKTDKKKVDEAMGPDKKPEGDINEKEYTDGSEEDGKVEYEDDNKSSMLLDMLDSETVTLLNRVIKNKASTKHGAEELKIALEGLANESDDRSMQEKIEEISERT